MKTLSDKISLQKTKKKMETEENLTLKSDVLTETYFQ